jgi:Ala-tRNA(Pro) deacylase
MEILNRIVELLQKNAVSFKSLHHEPTLTSEASAKARGEDLAIGGKAIVMKIDDDFKLFVLSATHKIDSKKIKEHFHAKKIRFASIKELMSLTGLVPGSVPPFGQPVLPLQLFADRSVTRNDNIAFNAGSLTDSIIMPVHDYIRIAEPEVFDFSL